MPEQTEKTGEPEQAGYNFGTFKGVFTPSILTILGIVMYLRFGWAIGHAGLAGTLAIVTIASAITFFTALSLSALATNMRIGGGGAYYIISRALGVEAGAAVGLPLFFAQALGISFYVAGFSESFVEIFPALVPDIIESLGFSGSVGLYLASHQESLVGVIILLLLAVMAYKSADLALKTQFIIMAAVFISLVAFFAGGRGHIPEAAEYVVADRRSFWAVFAVIFPAVTGIEAGIGMSGDLKDPVKSLPRGTIMAVTVGYVVYIAIVIFLWVSVKDLDSLTNRPMIMMEVARWGKPVMLGVWAAALSSAMGALLGAPRTLQALARDRVVPRFLGRGFGSGKDPRIATAAAFLVGLTGVLIGDLNIIAPLLTMFFLTSYGLLNVSAGLKELTSPPSWRPRFRPHWAVGISGALMCFAAMFMIGPGATFLAIFVAGAVYYLMERRSLKAWWGDMRSGIMMLLARHAVHYLSRHGLDEESWRPNILVFTGSPKNRWHLVELASAISQNTGFLTIAAIVREDMEAERVRNLTSILGDYLQKKDVSAVVKVFAAPTPLAGANSLVRAYGYGPIVPNTILIGETENRENYLEFAELVKNVKSHRQNLIVVRGPASEPEEQMRKERIDLWWYGTQQNLGFMLAICHMLKLSPDWRATRLVLKNIIEDEEKRSGTRERLNSFVTGVRLEADVEVMAKTNSDVFAMIRENSRDADLVFMGMRAPADDEDVETYREYYNGLLEKTRGLPPIALALAAEDMDFYSLFKEI